MSMYERLTALGGLGLLAIIISLVTIMIPGEAPIWAMVTMPLGIIVMIITFWHLLWYRVGRWAGKTRLGNTPGWIGWMIFQAVGVLLLCLLLVIIIASGTIEKLGGPAMNTTVDVCIIALLVIVGVITPIGTFLIGANDFAWDCDHPKIKTSQP